MTIPFRALTLSYKHAPLAIRDLVALNETACKSLLDKIKNFTPAREVLVLSTCNRTEVYYAAEEDLSRLILKLMALEKGFYAIRNLEPFFHRLAKQGQAETHLFRVALGLESQVAGDVQILNQVKQAYQWSADAGLCGPFLHRLLHTIFFTNKRVVNETAFRDGAASVSNATVALAQELTQAIANPRVLVIGAGVMGANVCLHLRKSGIQNLFICNRTYARSVDLARRAQATAVPWDQVLEQVHLADVVISAVPGDSFFLALDQVEAARLTGPRCFLDLSMPRSIDEQLNQLPAVSVYPVDAIRQQAGEALERRLAAIPQVEEILEESMVDFSTWTRSMLVSPAIQQFKDHLEEIRRQELARALKHLGAAEQQLVESITANILQKIVKLPALELKAACQRGASDSLVEGLTTLFNLEKQAVRAEKQSV